MNITNLTTTQLSQIITIKEQIEALESQIESIAGGGEVPIPATEEAPRRGRRSAAVRARMSAAAKARWARIKGTDATSKPVRGKRKLSASHRRKLIKALAKARKMRWAKAKAAKPARKDRRSSPAVRAKLAAAARARWARVRAEGKTRL
jgi:hypothetical protein